jgi:sugar phosphate isomerase/epimerase
MNPVLDRRALLAGATGLGLAALALPGTLASARRSYFERTKMRIGLQLYTLGEDPQKDLDGTLARVAAIGYRDLELPQLYGRTPSALKAAADRAGVSFSSIHLGVTPNMPKTVLSFISEPQRIADDLGALGIKNAVLPIVPIPANIGQAPGNSFQEKLAASLLQGGADIWKRTAALLNEKAAALEPLGISIGYHNHNVEFASLGKESGWDILVRETDRKLVHFEVDIGWVAAAGLDPVTFFKSTAGRVRWVHVKDVRATTKANFALAMDPAEVGSGKLDWAHILPAARKAGCQHFYVEQEAPFTMARIDAAAKSFAWLDKLRA